MLSFIYKHSVAGVPSLPVSLLESSYFAQRRGLFAGPRFRLLYVCLNSASCRWFTMGSVLLVSASACVLRCLVVCALVAKFVCLACEKGCYCPLLSYLPWFFSLVFLLLVSLVFVVFDCVAGRSALFLSTVVS